MPHIKLPEGLPGIRGPMAFRPETSKPLNELVEVLLHDPHTLTPGERELIATYVSSRNDCYYCQTVHGAIAAAHLNDDEELVQQVKRDFERAAVSDKLKALLVIAGKVQQGGKHVTHEDIDRARKHGATDLEIHDTVLIAAAFCMYNRYVDGLATFAPQESSFYRQRGHKVAAEGYLAVNRELANIGGAAVASSK
ncbi:MAG: peroxidase-related enzyme [Bryobacteraceae bacterium]